MMRRWLTITLLATIVAVALWLLRYGALPQAYDHDRFRTLPAASGITSTPSSPASTARTTTPATASRTRWASPSGWRTSCAATKDR